MDNSYMVDFKRKVPQIPLERIVTYFQESLLLANLESEKRSTRISVTDDNTKMSIKYHTDLLKFDLLFYLDPETTKIDSWKFPACYKIDISLFYVSDKSVSDNFYLMVRNFYDSEIGLYKSMRISPITAKFN